MTTEVEYRPAREGELLQCLAMGRKVLQESEGHWGTFDDGKVATLIILGRDPLSSVYCKGLFRNGELIGFCVAQATEYWYSRDEVVSDYMLYLLPVERKGRLALRMYRDLVEWCNNRKACELCLGVTAGIADAEAKELYEKLGHTRIGYLCRRRLR